MEQTTQTIVHKPNAALVMIPRTGKLNGIERKLFNSLLMSSIAQLNEYRSKHGSDPDNKYLYCASANELLDPIESGKSNLKSTLRKNILSLRRSEVDWEMPDAKSGIIWENMSILSQASFELRAGRLYVLWALPPGLNAAISDTKAFPFTKLDLDQISLLSSYTAVALYEICARYRNNFLRGGDGVCLTTSSEPNWWVDALTNHIPKINKASGEIIRREWRKVKSESVLKAIEEINAVTDLELELIERKVGKAVGHVQFSVRQKRRELKEIKIGDFEMIKQGTRLGIPQSRIEAALESNAKSELIIALAKFEARCNQKDLTPIDNPGAYFDSILRTIEPITIVSDAPKKTESAGHSGEKSKRDLAKTEFMLLAESQKERFSAKALAELKMRGLATPRIITNAQGGVWSGILLSKMIEIYAVEQHGEEWMVQSH